jgi:hypothetical protein
MPAFDTCNDRASLHFFSNDNHPCACGKFPNLVTANAAMESLKNARWDCVRSGCRPGEWEDPDLPECLFQLVQKCVRCRRTVCTMCQCPNVCDAHGLVVKDGTP